MYCENPYVYNRRQTREVKVGSVGIGGLNPVRVQSMITCDTMDTEASIRQTLDLAEVGCEIVRITAPTVKDAANLKAIVAGLRAQGCLVPIVADIHFKPEAAMEAAKWVEKIRVNPGNYADSKKFKILEYTDSQYAEELERIQERFAPLVKFCKENGRAMRIGTNHGSLSDRIMNRYGDSPLGMVESALEFARIARDLDYHEFMFSMKSSNPKVMVEAYRLLVARLAELDTADARSRNDQLEENDQLLMTNDQCQIGREADSGISHWSLVISHLSWSYPIHLGVTEAGDGEDARIKSAIGIGSLLADGIGDTIRVSLTEDSVHEIPVAQALVDRIDTTQAVELAGCQVPLSYDPFIYRRRASARLEIGGVPLGGEETIRVFTSQQKWDAVAHKLDKLGDYRPEIVLENSGVQAVDPRDSEAIAAINASPTPLLVTVADEVDLPVIPAFRLLAARLQERHPILLKDKVKRLKAEGSDCGEAGLIPLAISLQPLDFLLAASTHIGSLLCDGIGDAVLVQGEEAPGQSFRLSYNILQAAGSRIFKTDYVACPSCGRTLFNLQTTTAKIKAATAHLKGVKIAIMGCIVNGPGEMADADFGYVGGAPGKVNLYVGKTPVKFNIPEAQAVDQLQDLIREHGKWVEPAES